MTSTYQSEEPRPQGWASWLQRKTKL